MDSRLPLSPWASDGFFLLVRRLPGWPQAMWGHRRSYCVTSAFGDSHRTPRGAREVGVQRTIARWRRVSARPLPNRT